ncbi:MAG TPA: hypothetical protein VK196_13205 [Magnetospirillum sp.]|nr:hypothetical protein [Magnetospirillum sp.]
MAAETFPTNPAATRTVSGPQAANMMDGTSYLNAQYGVVFDTHVVVAHELAGVVDHNDASQRVWLLLHRLQKWFRRRNADAFYVYVHENSRDKGFHTHLLLHAGAWWPELKAWLPEAVSRLWGGPLPKGMLHIKHRNQAKLEHRIALQWIWVRYLLKGVASSLAVVCPDSGEIKPVHQVLRLRLRAGGEVRCRKRVGVSSNIGRSARERSGYVSLFAAGQDDRLFSGDEFRRFEERRRQEEVNRFLGVLSD